VHVYRSPATGPRGRAHPTGSDGTRGRKIFEIKAQTTPVVGPAAMLIVCGLATALMGGAGGVRCFGRPVTVVGKNFFFFCLSGPSASGETCRKACGSAVDDARHAEFMTPPRPALGDFRPAEPATAGTGSSSKTEDGMARASCCTQVGPWRSLAS